MPVLRLPPIAKSSTAAIVYAGFLVELVRWIIFWSAVFAIQWLLWPHWLIRTEAGVSTLLQALPATVVALVTVILASIFAIAVQVVALYGPRAVIIVFLDSWVLNLGMRALVLTVATLLAAGRLPTDAPPGALTGAALATLALAICGLVLRTLVVLFTALTRFTAPRNFSLAATAGVFDLLRVGAPGLVGFRLGMFGEMIRAGIRRGDSTTVEAGVEALMGIQVDYYRAVAENPEAAALHVSTGRRDRWAAEDINSAIMRAAEEALKQGAPEIDLDGIANAHEWCGQLSIEKRAPEDAAIFVDGITRLGVTSHQVSASTINLYPYSALSLARLEATAEDAGDTSLAALALAGWSLVVSYTTTHFNAVHPQLFASAKALGDRPPLDDAAAFFDDPRWLIKWANKLEAGPAGPVLHIAEIEALRNDRYPWGAQSPGDETSVEEP